MIRDLDIRPAVEADHHRHRPDERGAPWVELGVYEFNATARDFYLSRGYGPLLTKLRRLV